MNAQSQRQLEWELGRVELMMEGVSKNKAGINDRMEIVRGQQEQKGKYIIYMYHLHKKLLDMSIGDREFRIRVNSPAIPNFVVGISVFSCLN